MNKVDKETLKPVMPKVFDEWVAMEVTGELYWDIEVLNDVLANNLPLGSDETQEKLAEWVGVSYDTIGEYTDFMPRYEKCIKALMYGYTIEDPKIDQNDQQEAKEGNTVMDKPYDERCKPEMPKVFDTFVQAFYAKYPDGDRDTDDLLELLLGIYTGRQEKYDNLFEYIQNHGGMNFYTKCVQAIVYGYTVEPEKYYYVKVDGTHLFFSIVHGGVYSKLATVNCSLDKLKEFTNQAKYQFAEKDIKLHGLENYEKIEVENG